MFGLLNNFLFLPKDLIMKRIAIRTICYLLLLMAGFTGYAQTKSSTKPAATKKPVQKVDAVKEEQPPVVETIEEPQPPKPQLPPLPVIDTTAAPNDELTAEVKKLLAATGIMKATLQTMKNMLDIQRRSMQQLPAEFFDRFTLYVENGRVERLMENLIIKIYRQKFTANDIKEVNKFYETPVGKKLAAETVNITTAARAEGEKVGQFMGLQIAHDLMKEGKWK
jgi:Trm5-related predicted tRNA methylase